jgi:surfeit locus 1 family protein
VHWPRANNMPRVPSWAPTQVGATLLDPELTQDAPLVVTGTYDATDSFYVDNRQMDGRPGLHKVTPLKIAGTQTRILINRGWVPWGTSRSQLPTVDTPIQTVTVTGIAAVPTSKGFFLMPDRPEAWPELWSRLDLKRYTAQSNHPVQQVVLLQTSDDGGPMLVRKWPPPRRPGRHAPELCNAMVRHGTGLGRVFWRCQHSAQ